MTFGEGNNECKETSSEIPETSPPETMNINERFIKFYVLVKPQLIS
jgi:hypothetical protein